MRKLPGNPEPPHGNDGWNEFATAHARKVYAVAYQQLGNRELARDAAQMTFMAFLIRYQHDGSQPLPAENARGWLLRTTRYICRHIERTNQRRQKHERRAAMARAEDGQWRTPEPTRAKRLATISEALRQVPRHEREILRAKFQHALSTAAIARDLGVSEEAARQRIARALQHLRRIVRQQDGRQVYPEMAPPLAVPAAAARKAARLFRHILKGTVGKPAALARAKRAAWRWTASSMHVPTMAGTAALVAIGVSVVLPVVARHFRAPPALRPHILTSPHHTATAFGLPTRLPASALLRQLRNQAAPRHQAPFAAERFALAHTPVALGGPAPSAPLAIGLLSVQISQPLVSAQRTHPPKIKNAPPRRPGRAGRSVAGQPQLGTGSLGSPNPLAGIEAAEGRPHE